MNSVANAAQSSATGAESEIAGHLPILPQSPAPFDLRQRTIAEAAYFLAQQRGFAPGMELDDWRAAENAIDREPHQGAG